MFNLDLWSLLISVPAILVAITFHEYAHGKVADLLGDPTPAAQGRLSLNPLKHLDPMGTLMLILVRFGWAKPVQVNPLYFKGDRIKGMMYVGLAGPAMNLALAYLSAIALRLVPYGGWAAMFFTLLLWYNAMLAVFNLIPLPPLDGSKILAGILPPAGARLIYSLEQYGPMILLLLLFTGLVGRILSPAVNWVINFLLTLAGWSWF